MNALRVLAREQGDLYIACYAEAIRVHEEMDSVDKQLTGGEADRPETGDDDPPPFDGDSEEDVDPVLDTTVELFRAAWARINSVIGAGPESSKAYMTALEEQAKRQEAAKAGEAAALAEVVDEPRGRGRRKVSIPKPLPGQNLFGNTPPKQTPEEK